MESNGDHVQPLVRILYAEDEPDIRQVVSLALHEFGEFTLKICSSGLEVVSEIEAFEPHLLLLDVVMPDLDGLDTLKEIRRIQTYKETPVIFLTAKIQPDEVQNYFEMGVVDVFFKPFDPVTLAEKIREAWAKVSLLEPVAKCAPLSLIP
jgi:two-component system OmpR family response regulator